jgi:NAD(P)-dependent dehydrogenase (short-subunit alcohol dehydrogenase family)
MNDTSKPLANRIALVTGTSRGIGHAAAIALAKAGAHVVATARTVGGLEELDDSIKAAGGSATLVPLELRDVEGIARLAAALDERYGRLDVLIGNAALGASNSPLDHFHPNEWDEVIAVNVTANWHLIRFFNPLLRKSDAARAVFLTSGAGTNPRPYRGLYSTSKAALEAMVRTYAGEINAVPPLPAEDLKVHAERVVAQLQCDPIYRDYIGVLLNNEMWREPLATRTRMRAAVMPGEDPMTLPTPEEVAATIVPLCLPSCTETGKIYDFRFKKLMSFRVPE